MTYLSVHFCFLESTIRNIYTHNALSQSEYFRTIVYLLFILDISARFSGESIVLELETSKVNFYTSSLLCIAALFKFLIRRKIREIHPLLCVFCQNHTLSLGLGLSHFPILLHSLADETVPFFKGSGIRVSKVFSTYA